MEIEDVYEDLYLHRECKKVTIFLSVFDVHANRAPIEGKITYRHYTMGSFLPAFKEDVGFENERHTICIENDKNRSTRHTKLQVYWLVVSFLGQILIVYYNVASYMV